MAVPFYVPSDGGSESATGSTTGPTQVMQRRTQVAASPGATLPAQDPLLDALCEALYRVIVARGGQVNLSSLPPPSPTCSPHQPHYADVFFPNIPNSYEHPPNNYRQSETPLTPRTTELIRSTNERTYGSSHRYSYEQDSGEVGRRNDEGRRSSARFEDDERFVDNEDLRVFEGTVPQRRRKVKDKTAEKSNKEVLSSWPVVTALLVAVGCGILRATR